MQFKSLNPFPVLMLVAVLGLSACESAEERAEERYQSAVALAEAGDFDRAIVELRSVFDLNPSHREARRKLAELIRDEKGNTQGSYAQYLRLAEQYPDDLDARTALAEMAFALSNWDEVERHGEKAAELNPDNPRVLVINVLRAYRAAALDQDNAARREQARLAERLLSDQPDNTLLRSVLVDSYLNERELPKALGEIDWLIENDPENILYLRQRLNILAQLQDFEALEAQLRDMVAQFSDDDTHKATLIRFYLSRNERDKAEAFMRELSAASDDIGPRVDLIQFLVSTKGVEAGRAEVAAALNEHKDDVRLQIIGAGLDFGVGNRDSAIAALEAIIAKQPDSAYIAEVRVTLARMLLETGNEVGARALVEETLQNDPANVDALKMQAAWLIEADDTDAAIAALRSALDAASEDADAMTLMARAYLRSGRQELAKDFLALAVEASGSAPAETVRYARVLISEEQFLPAEDILLNALRLAPQNGDLLIMLGQVYLRLEDMGRTDQVVQSLRRLDTPQSTQAANQLEAERINRQSGPDAAVKYLSDVAELADATLASKISLIQVRLRTGSPEAALELARQIAADNPDNILVKNVLASVEAVNGNLDTAEKLYEEVLKVDPKQPAVWIELSQIKSRQTAPEDAQNVIERGLEELPGNVNLLWAIASVYERNGDYDGAIGIYEDLYGQNSNSTIIANNLASLLSTHKTDEASLERAWTIARRLRNTEVPEMQDTYGWIAHRRGESEEALPYLTNAASRLPQDPLINFHLAEVLRTLGREGEALDFYRLVIANANPTDVRPQIAAAREWVKTLETSLAQE